MKRTRAGRTGWGLSAVLVIIAGCSAIGAGSSPAPSPEAPAPSAPAWMPRPTFVAPFDELLFEGRLLICSDLPYPPQEFFDPLGNPIGSDIEIGEEIARRLGLEASIVNSLFDTIIDAVNGGKCDIVISAQNITPERQRLVDMIPYFQAGQSFVVVHDNPAGIHNELDLCGRRIGAQSGTVQAQLAGTTQEGTLSAACEVLGKPPLRLVTFEKDDEALAALQSGEVDAYFTDSPAAGYHVVNNAASLELAGPTIDVAVQGISIPKDRSRLRDAVETALHSMMADGSYLEILARYGVENGSVAMASTSP